MPKLTCPACGSRLNVPEKLMGSPIKCPKCGEPVALPGEVGSPAEPTGEQPTGDAGRISGPSRSLAAASELAQEVVRKSVNPGKAGFRFKTYWTPWIIRYSWYVVLAFAVLWAIFLSIGFVAALTSGPQTSLLDSFGMSDLSVSSLDLEGIMSGNADVEGLNEFLDQVTEQGDKGTSRSRKQTAFQKFMAYGFTSLSFLTLIVSSLLTVLFCRVFFECIALLFGMADSLKKIENRSDDPAIPGG